MKKIKTQQCYLQAARCLNSERSWCYSRHCRYSWPPRGTEGADVMVRFLYSITVHSCVLTARLTWIFMATSLPSFSRAKCTWPMDAAANGFSSKYSSWSLQFGPRSLLMAFCGERRGSVSPVTSVYRVCVVYCSSLYKYCTIICLEGMKSALWRTRSKILANWGLMKASSERRGDTTETRGVRMINWDENTEDDQFVPNSN